jgi:hypothetical protein
MEKTEITRLVEDRYSDATQPYVTRVICKNDLTFYGYFNTFDDYSELKERNQYRFIPRNNLSAYKDEFVRKGKHNLNHSVVINGDDVLDIEFVLPLHI